jgi:hypothetical protein
MSHATHAVQSDCYGADTSKLKCHTCQRLLSDEEADDYRALLGNRDDSIPRLALYSMRQWARNEVLNDRAISIVDSDGYVVHAHYHPSKQAWAWEVLRNNWERYEDKADVLRAIETCKAVLP